MMLVSVAPYRQVLIISQTRVVIRGSCGTNKKETKLPIHESKNVASFFFISIFFLQVKEVD